MSVKKLSHFQLKKIEIINTKCIYDKLINWVIGEFDVYLMKESENLKVYFPNGKFRISCFKNEHNQELLEILVIGTSKTTCQNIMSELDAIYNHVLRFFEIKSTA